MKMHRMLLLLLVLTLPASLRAQFGLGKIEEIESVKTRRLIVMIEEPRERVLKKIAKRPKLGTVAEYKADLEKYNANIRSVVEKFWSYNTTGIQYKTLQEIKELAKTKTKDFAVLMCVSSKASQTRAGNVNYEGISWAKDIKEDFEDRDDDMFTTMAVNTIEDFGGAPVYFLPLFDVFPTQASLVYGVKGIEGYFDFRIRNKKYGEKAKDIREQAKKEMAVRAPHIAEKILLIRKEWLDKDLTESNFGKYYPYPFKVCDRDEMDRVVMSQDPKYAYAVEMPYVVSTSHSNSMLYLQYVIDATDCQPVILVMPSTGASMLGASVTGRAGTRNFTEKTLAKIVDQIKGKE